MIEDTVFEPSFGNRPSRLVGRAEVLRHFQNGLASRPGSRERAMLLLGQRGSGKTVLLWELADLAREAGFVVATPTVSTEDMLERIVEKLQDDGERFVKSRKSAVTGGSVGVLGFSAGLQFSRDVRESKSFQFKLTRLCRALSEMGHGVLVLVDEVQSNTPQMRQLVAAYQEIVGEGLDIALAMAGLPAAVSSTLNDRVLTFLNRARKIELGPLSPIDVDAFYASSFAQLGMHVEDAVREMAVRAVQGSPYLMQLVGHAAVAFSGDDGTLGSAAMGRAVARAREDFETDVCATTLAGLSGRDRDFLAAMARCGAAEDVAMGDIAKAMGVSGDYARRYRTRLADAGVIRVTRRSHVAFAVPHLGDYLRKRG